MSPPQPEHHDEKVSVSWKRLALWEWGLLATTGAALLWFVMNDRAAGLERVSSAEQNQKSIEARVVALEIAIQRLPTKADLREILDDQLGRRDSTRRQP